MIIGLPHDLTKFRSISIKPYFIDDQQPVSDSPVPTEIPQRETPPADIFQRELATKSPLATLASLVSVKRGRGQPRKYPKQANNAAPSDIYFFIDESDVFITNADTPPTQYNLSR